MSMSKEEVFGVFRHYASIEFEGIPKNDSEIDYVFSDGFNRKMEKLLSQINERVGISNEKAKLKGFKKVVALVATLALVLVVTFSVSSFVFGVDLFDGLAQLYNGYFRVYFDSSKSNTPEYKLQDTKLAKELAENGISPVLLPEAILKDDYEITSVEYFETDVVSSAIIKFTSNGRKGYLLIEKFPYKVASGYADYLYSTERVEKIEVSGIYVYVIEQNGKCKIAYQDEFIGYTIQTSLNFEDAMEFAKTIK